MLPAWERTWFMLLRWLSAPFRQFRRVSLYNAKRLAFEQQSWLGWWVADLHMEDLRRIEQIEERLAYVHLALPESRRAAVTITKIRLAQLVAVRKAEMKEWRSAGSEKTEADVRD